MPCRFNVVALLGLSLAFLSSWDAVAASMGVRLTAGGLVVLVYGFLFVISTAAFGGSRSMEVFHLCVGPIKESCATALHSFLSIDPPLAFSTLHNPLQHLHSTGTLQHVRHGHDRAR